MKSLLFGVVAIAACGSKSSDPPKAEPASKPAPTPVDAAAPVADAAPPRGKPQLLALDAAGALVARTADGSETRSLASGPYDAALFDEPRELVWLRGKTTLDVLDLRAPAKVVTIATSASFEPMVGLGVVFAGPPSWTAQAAQLIFANPCNGVTTLDLSLASGGASVEGITFVGKDWFAANQHRKERTGLPKPVEKLQERTKRATRPIGRTDRLLMLASYDPERCPSEECALVDAKTNKQLTDPDGQTCGPYLLDADQTTYLIADKVCTADAKCTSVGKQALGWLDGSNIVDWE